MHKKAISHREEAILSLPFNTLTSSVSALGAEIGDRRRKPTALSILPVIGSYRAGERDAQDSYLATGDRTLGGRRSLRGLVNSALLIGAGVTASVIYDKKWRNAVDNGSIDEFDEKTSSKILKHLGPALITAGSLAPSLGRLASVFTPQQSKEDRQKYYSGHFKLKELLIPGYAAYQHGKATGALDHPSMDQKIYGDDF